MRFSSALIECMDGKRITRTDWNGKHMYVYYVQPRKIAVKDWKGNIPLTDSEKIRGYVEIAGHFDMMNAQGIRIIGWLASQTDMSSDKWVVLDDPVQEAISQVKEFTREKYFADDEDNDPSDHARNQYPNVN